MLFECYTMRLITLFLTLSLSLCSTLASAEVYRWINADGNVVYGDDPPKKSGATRVELPTLTVADSYKAAPVKSTTKTEASETEYTSFKIATPATGDTLRANDGAVGFSVELQPALKPGDAITLYLDGKQVGTGETTSFSLTDIPRGEHTVFALVSNKQGEVVKNTEGVKFNVLRASVL